MIRTFAVLSMILVLILAGCGGDDDDGGDVASAADAETCEQLGPLFGANAQELLDGLSDLTLADMSGDEQPEALTTFEESMAEVEARSDELVCSDEELTSIVTDEIDDLEADGPVAELILQGLEEGVQSGEIFESGN